MKTNYKDFKIDPDKVIERPPVMVKDGGIAPLIILPILIMILSILFWGIK